MRVTTIRHVTSDDVDAIVERLTFDPLADIETIALVGDEARASRYIRARLFAKHSPFPEWDCVVAEADNTVVGLLDYSRSGSHRSRRLKLLTEVVGPVQFLRALPVLYGRLRVDMDVPDDVFPINDIRVDRGWRNQGIGTQLLEWAETEARRRGYDRVMLQALTNNPALRLYERHGFRTVMSRTHWLYTRAVGAGRCLMEKVL